MTRIRKKCEPRRGFELEVESKLCSFLTQPNPRHLETAQTLIDVTLQHLPGFAQLPTTLFGGGRIRQAMLQVLVKDFLGQ